MVDHPGWLIAAILTIRDPESQRTPTSLQGSDRQIAGQDLRPDVIVRSVETVPRQQ